MGLQVQVKPRLAQGAQGWRLGWSGRGLLLPQCDGARVIWGSREHAHSAAWALASEPSRQPQARALAQARRALRHRRILQRGTVPGIVRSVSPTRLARVGSRSGSVSRAAQKAIPGLSLISSPGALGSKRRTYNAARMSDQPPDAGFPAGIQVSADGQWVWNGTA